VLAADCGRLGFDPIGAAGDGGIGEGGGDGSMTGDAPEAAPGAKSRPSM